MNLIRYFFDFTNLARVGVDEEPPYRAHCLVGYRRPRPSVLTVPTRTAARLIRARF